MTAKVTLCVALVLPRLPHSLAPHSLRAGRPAMRVLVSSDPRPVSLARFGPRLAKYRSKGPVPVSPRLAARSAAPVSPPSRSRAVPLSSPDRLARIASPRPTDPSRRGIASRATPARLAAARGALRLAPVSLQHRRLHLPCPARSASPGSCFGVGGRPASRSREAHRPSTRLARLGRRCGSPPARCRFLLLKPEKRSASVDLADCPHRCNPLLPVDAAAIDAAAA